LGFRRATGSMTVVLLLAVVACEPGERPAQRPPAQAERSVGQGREFARQLADQGQSGLRLSAGEIVGLGYLERHRLGLGSPFRLIDFALNDPRMTDSTRLRVARALLAATLRGDGYRIDPAVMNRLGPPGVPTGAGRHHVELIEEVVREARDPRSGELAVRLAYALAAAEGTLVPHAPGIAARVAALVRDRQLARQDARRLIRHAEAVGVDPVRLVPAWRLRRRFAVELPVTPALPLEVERTAVELAPLLTTGIRSLGVRPPSALPAAPPRYAPLLGPLAAQRLAALADTLNFPPQTPVVVALQIYRALLEEQPRLTAEARSARQRFATGAWNEERFAASYALLIHRGAAPDRIPALVALRAAASMRTYGQEPVWFPGDGGPTARELEDRFRLNFVTFDDDVPAAWRPYYRRMLHIALSDLFRVFPFLDLSGLRVRFSDERVRPGTLALHSPGDRTLHLPPSTAAGTLAHEIAHDLDWQIALRRYRLRGSYATDHAARLRRDPLAFQLQELTSERLAPPVPGDRSRPDHTRRPAEVFARSVDWLTQVSLAREGRLNGYLSSIQDDVLTGYGTAAPPDVSGRAGEALIAILDEVAPLYSEGRQWFLDSYGRGRVVTPHDLVRRVAGISTAGTEEIVVTVDAHVPPPDSAAEAQPEAPLATRFADVVVARDAALQDVTLWGCRAPGAAQLPQLESARRRLVIRAAGARARGIALAYAGVVGGLEGQRWLMRAFYGAPWPNVEVDEAMAAFLGRLAEQAAAVEGPETPLTVRPFELITTRAGCPPSPFPGLTTLAP
jgi:hypothetical protein